ncbi:ZIP zinc/iron transport family [Xylaria sp. CBS 124048]|nr:ZIP zinc/iron transport family [Xylaria sp. CBS 124048]
MDITSAAMSPMLALRDDGGRSVVVDCDNGNGFDGRLGPRISSIFVIMFGSFLGAVVPVVLARKSKMKVNGTAFFIAKHFGSGVIVATAFMHLLAPAFEALNSPCLPEGPIRNYDFAAAICLMTVLVMFTLELIVTQFDVFGHNHSKSTESSPARRNTDVEAKASSSAADGSEGSTSAEARGAFYPPGLPNDVSYPPGGQDHLAHQHDEAKAEEIAAQLTAIFILEFGVVFHSIFIGLTLAVAGDEFNVLYVVLVFHQTFEGLGLGSRLAIAQWPESKRWLPYALGFGYSLSTPVSIAIGLGISSTLQPGSASALLINGVFDSISAGILIYTGLVELLAHEFMFNPHMRASGLKVQLFALFWVAFGAGLMALLAIWA